MRGQQVAYAAHSGGRMAAEGLQHLLSSAPPPPPPAAGVLCLRSGARCAATRCGTMMRWRHHIACMHACRAGARLTAFELVHDGLPATLICDSAAASLMAGGRVDAVVVGADRCAQAGTRAPACASAQQRGFMFPLGTDV